MKKANFNALQPLLLGFALVAATPSAPLWAEPIEQNGVVNTEFRDNTTLETNAKGTATASRDAALSPNATQVNELTRRVDELTNKQDASDAAGLLGIAWPLWLAGGSSVLSLLALMMAMSASKNRKKQHGEILRLFDEIKKIRGNNQKLLLRIGGVEAQMEQGKMNWSGAIATSTQKTGLPQAQPSSAISWPVPLPVIEPLSVPDPYPVPAPAPAPGPPAVNRTSLTSSLNMGDRQQLRELATAELNITSESENALAMGRAIATELEEVPGGGSYWLVTLQGEHLLFPTDRTIKGFAVAHPAKGLFHYEQQTIAQPQLIEPALLEKRGTRWCVKTMGRIAVP